MIPSLALFGFVLLYYYFCDVCSDIQTWIFYIMLDFFSSDQNYKKYDQLELSILLLIQKTTPTVTGLKYQNGQFIEITDLWLKLDLWDEYVADNIQINIKWL